MTQAAAPQVTANPPSPRLGPDAVLLADRREGPDLWGVSQAMQPLAELCLSAEAETPFALGLIGPRGAGKSFALRRLLEAVETRASAARAPTLSKVVVAQVDAASAAGEPAAAVAAAVYAALERDYASLAEEATHAALDPRHAATAAAERHDEIVARLEQERRARDEVEARRARLTESLLFETPGSRVDAFVRAGRAGIEARLRGFGFAGDGDANFRTLLRELAASRVSRASLFLRAMWSYSGQTAFILFAILCLALAFGLSRLREPATQDSLVSLYAQLGPLADWARGRDGALEYASESLVVAGLAAILVNLWRAAGFTGLMFRGLRMLNLDVRERRRELDASAARLERRVAALRIEADAAQGRSEALARRAGGQPATRAPVPTFFARNDAPERGARSFLEEIGRAMEAGASPAPQRLILAIDGVDALPDAEARRFLEVAVRVAARNVAVIAAADLSRFGAEARAIGESLFEIVYEVGAATGDDAPAGRLLGGPVAAPAPVAPPAPLGGRLDETEIGYLKAASALVGVRPRALKRFYNAYRLARLTDVPRAALALSLAALMASDPGPAAALRWAVLGEGEALESPAELGSVMAGLGLQEIGKAGARRAYEAARRYAPWG